MADRLFSHGKVEEVLDEARKHCLEEAHQIRLTGATKEGLPDLARGIVQRHALGSLEVVGEPTREEEIERHGGGDPAVTILQEFKGNADLADLRPTIFQLQSAPRGRRAGHHFTLEYTVRGGGAENLTREIEADVKRLRDMAREVTQEVQREEEKTLRDVVQVLEHRLEALGAAKATTSELKFPIRRREAPPQTATPTMARKPPPTSMIPVQTPAAAEADPILEMQEYEFILKILRDMAKVIEKSPRAFRAMGVVAHLDCVREKLGESRITEGSIEVGQTA
ncbi:MAG: hypothetical protein IT452_04360 [Planctomycetia bacterium]|nr:hypothetical protein [Planctomycetia bacterium]